MSKEAPTTEQVTRLDEPLYPILQRTEAVKAADEVHITRFMYSEGVTKRELFAAMAMQSIRTVNPACSSQEVAQSAVADADALLKELSK